MLVKVQFGPPDVVDRKTGFVFHTVQPNITDRAKRYRAQKNVKGSDRGLLGRFCAKWVYAQS